ncbi:MAG: hypothetical protein ABJF01_05690 [bacterium]
MRIDVMAHILGGTVGIVAGFAALYTTKGAPLHRRVGMVFVYAMLAMSVMGAGMAALRNVAPQANVPAGLLTAYLVVTGLTTVRPPARWSRPLAVGLLLLALAVGLTDFTLGLRAITSSNAKTHWMVIPFSIFATVALVASAGDIRLLRSGALRGASRLARHLWRMSFALFIAAFSFFIGQAKVIPKSMRIYPLLALPVVVILATMVYWLWRVRSRRLNRGIVIRSAPATLVNDAHVAAL